MAPTSPRRKKACGELKKTVLITKGKYKGQNGFIQSMSKSCVEVILSKSKKVQIPKLSVTHYYRNDLDSMVLLDAAAMRCCEHIMSAGAGFSVQYYIERFKEKLNKFFDSEMRNINSPCKEVPTTDLFG